MGALSDLSQIEVSIQNEESAFMQYLKLYERTNPKTSYGWLSAITAVSIISLMLVAALRTGFSFFLSAFMSLNQFLSQYVNPNIVFFASMMEALCAVFGVEGFIVTAGLKNGISRAEESLSSSRKITSGILLAVSCVAGLSQSSYLAQGTGNASQAIEVALMLFTGIGIPIAIVFAAPYLGMMLNYGKIAEKKWLEEARAAWKQSREYREYRMVQKNGYISSTPAPQVGGPQVAQSPSASKIISQYRESNGLGEDTPLRASQVTRDYYARSGINPTEDESRRLSGTIRTALSRERGG